MKSFDFQRGDKVRYIPRHAKGDYKHKDCRNGVVSSVNSSWVFVSYDFDLYNTQATDSNDLIPQLIYKLIQ
jgi:hypothetical protein|tara:strand:+ start:1353 stop:1565 length:213 start_codon:yes stop_codon:yes gene_type:complete